MASVVTEGRWVVRPYGLRWESELEESEPITQDILGIRDRVLAGIAMSELTSAIEFHARADAKYHYTEVFPAPANGDQRLVAYFPFSDTSIATIQGCSANGWRFYIHRPHGRWSEIYPTAVEAVDAAVTARAFPLREAV